MKAANWFAGPRNLDEASEVTMSDYLDDNPLNNVDGRIRATSTPSSGGGSDV